MGPRVLIVIPAHNEEGTIAQVLLRLRRVAPDFERLVVDDSSTDSTGRIVAELGERRLSLACNIGYGHALQTGLIYALQQGYDIAVCFDADGQHRPEDVPAVVSALLETGADMVIGSRFCHGRPYTGSLVRRLGQVYFSHLTRLLTGRRIYDTLSGFKALRAEACAAMIQGSFMDFHTETITRLSLLGFTILEHPIIGRERTWGSSMHSFSTVAGYPMKTMLLTMVALVDAMIVRRPR
jgi:glycosyltransferase involved in cell wall biosynthesis